ncbi:hypothetical protein HELRODRAFT_70983, partial [Helobdella robusta]|uniref:G-protein coupled receptors family 1 profile domain-containing protein n=1 Tax=Helobdella robusta TaxID=6412 RepID=T1G0F3_HELRO
YYAIHDPIRYAQKRTLKRVLTSIIIVWFVSAVISMPPLLTWFAPKHRMSLYSSVDLTCELIDDPSYVIYSASGSFFIPLIIMIFVYVNVYLATKSRLRRRAKMGKKLLLTNVFEVNNSTASSSKRKESKNVNITSYLNHCRINVSCADDMKNLGDNKIDDVLNENKNNKNNKKVYNNNRFGGMTTLSKFLEEKQRISLSLERRAARTMAIIMGAFVFCWLPFFVYYIVGPLCPQCYQSNTLMSFFVWLGYINSTINPVIYTVFNIDFRRSFKNILTGKCRN